ncbi:MAG: quinolinate synthase NadA [Planctomycetes bacterium]|nr:quinolinate synthase NadA [Planctomycetota bacterium]
MDEIVTQINRLRKERNAIILAHNYQRPEVQDIADYVGDSLGLAQTAAKSKAEIIVFCGVHFMAETAAIICPDKTVLMPDPHAGCPLANMITLRELRKLKAAHSGAVVVTYINSSAEIKAESDYCCTSSNAVKVVQSIPPGQEIIFIPDQHLGSYVQSQAGRPMILWRGYCPTHQRILSDDIKKKKSEHPKALVVVHPECSSDVVALADKVASTSGILKYCRESPAYAEASAGRPVREFIIGTEIGLLHRLQKENSDKVFMAGSDLADCPNMKLNTLEKILWSLEDMVYAVKVAPEIAAGALKSINRMLTIV